MIGGLEIIFKRCKNHHSTEYQYPTANAARLQVRIEKAGDLFLGWERGAEEEGEGPGKGDFGKSRAGDGHWDWHWGYKHKRFDSSRCQPEPTLPANIQQDRERLTRGAKARLD